MPCSCAIHVVLDYFGVSTNSRVELMISTVPTLPTPGKHIIYADFVARCTVRSLNVTGEKQYGSATE